VADELAHITVLFPFMAPAQLTPPVLAELRHLFLSQAVFGFQLGFVGRFPATTYLSLNRQKPLSRSPRRFGARIRPFLPSAATSRPSSRI
jgi:hypothetical protein